MKRVIAVAICIVGFGALAMFGIWLNGSSFAGATSTNFPDGVLHEYPTPSYWPRSPYPGGLPTTQANPIVVISPCPSWAPTLVYHPNGNYYECKANIPPDPGGPVLASPVASPVASPSK